MYGCKCCVHISSLKVKVDTILKINIARVPQPIRTRVRMRICDSQSEAIIYNRATMLGVHNKESYTDSQTDYTVV